MGGGLKGRLFIEKSQSQTWRISATIFLTPFVFFVAGSDRLHTDRPASNADYLLNIAVQAVCLYLKDFSGGNCRPFDLST